jgi:hypothetical protein
MANLITASQSNGADIEVADAKGLVFDNANSRVFLYSLIATFCPAIDKWPIDWSWTFQGRDFSGLSMDEMLATPMTNT